MFKVKKCFISTIIQVPVDWKNPKNEYHIGMKSAFSLFPKLLKERIKVRFFKKRYILEELVRLFSPFNNIIVLYNIYCISLFLL